jgi:uncharacterized protein (UPF0333 family)
MVRRAQVSVEFLMVVGIAMLMMTVSTYLVFDYTQSYSSQNAMQQVAQIGYELIDDASAMYIYGSGSFGTLSASLPENIYDISVVDNTTLVFELNTQRGIIPVYIFSEIPINGTRNEGNKVYVSQSQEKVHPGTTEFRIESKGDWVEIRQVS